jgi:hypothetical protein
MEGPAQFGQKRVLCIPSFARDVRLRGQGTVDVNRPAKKERHSQATAGNPPGNRVEKLREFWEAVSTPPLGIPCLDR